MKLTEFINGCTSRTDKLLDPIQDGRHSQLPLKNTITTTQSILDIELEFGINWAQIYCTSLFFKKLS